MLSREKFSMPPLIFDVYLDLQGFSGKTKIKKALDKQKFL